MTITIIKISRLQLCRKRLHYQFSVIVGYKNRRDSLFLAGCAHEMCRGSQK